MKKIVSVNKVLIRFPLERWRHIMSNHPELKGMRSEIGATIEQPAIIFAGKDGECIASRPKGSRHLVVVYKEIDALDGFVITAFITRDIGYLL